MKINELVVPSTTKEDIQMHNELVVFTSAPCNKFILMADRLLHEEVINMFEMSNLQPKETGIQNIIIWVNSGADKLQHGPRIKVVKGNKFRPELSSTIPLTGVPRVIGNADLTQDEFAQIMAWINLNREIILMYGNDEIDTATMITKLQKV